MREIKFRAWDKNAVMMRDDGTYPNGKPHMKYDVGVMSSDARNEWATGIDGLEIRVNSNSFHLMQYTGLLDKDGKEIYEGDIIDFKLGDGLDNEKGVVRFSKGGFWTSTDGDLYEELLSEELNDLHGTVVGNIYEHKHLLENEIH